ncbi:helix-turn-helix transcriptional regulator [Streptantibioticus silvisoli]|uniref:WYL domain-containing protein n=1 Tax=Streptantibioticus silvisoli TaxID=2705255 RepID=A0ABT6W2J9_9ACTN|nr:WYL domain-containing protein [Streptantibioticus silvisoli]MDI5964630.1 WYL domain-containing protein [Streptantibioticus silvisoli]
MKADRLLSILLLLQTRGKVSATELADRLEVSVRTVYRDVEALSAAGVPVWAERGRTGGVRLMPGYRTDVTGMTADEARALFVLAADGAHEALGLGTAIASALRKLLAALPAGHRPAAEAVGERVLVDPVRWMRGGGAGPAVELGVLQGAVFGDRRLRLAYRRSGEARASTRVVDPYGLVSKAGVWYLVADLDGEARLFRVDRMREAEVMAEPVLRRPGVTLADVWAALRAGVERPPSEVPARCRVRNEILDMFLRLHAGNVTGPAVPGDDGWSEVPLVFRVPRAARALLAFGADVELLTPPGARRELAVAAAEAAALYGPPPTDGRP